MASDPAHIVPAAEITHGLTDPTLNPPPVDRVSDFEARLVALETKLESLGASWIDDLRVWFLRHTGT